MPIKPGSVCPRFSTTSGDVRVQSLLTEALSENRPIPNPAQQIKDVALRLRNQFIDRELDRLKLRANQPQTTDAEAVEILTRQQELRSLKRAAFE